DGIRDFHVTGVQTCALPIFSLAGVMGGASTEIRDDSTDVLLEAAHWDPAAISRTARRHNLFSEAAKRFERFTDPALCATAVEVEIGRASCRERASARRGDGS